MDTILPRALPQLKTGCPAAYGHHMMGLDIKYSVANAQGRPQTSRELVIMNWKQEDLGQLF
jgi:hypothetical protein